jgi:hypothetical protein
MSTLDDIPPSRLRTMQIIAGTLLFGVLAFVAVALFIVHVQNGGRGTGPPDHRVLSFVAVAMQAVNVLLSFIIPGMMAKGALRRIASGTWRAPPQADPAAYSTDAAKLLAVRQTTLIVALALLEGAAFLGGIAYLLEARPKALVGVGLAVWAMLYHFPTESRTRYWLERQAGVLAGLRQEGGGL